MTKVTVAVTATVTFVKAAPQDGAGVRCDEGDRAHLRYTFEINGQGAWMIFKIDEQGHNPVLLQGTDPAIVTGTGPNTITGTCTEKPDGTTQLSMVVNHVALGSVSDAHPGPVPWHGTLIVYRSATSPGTEVRFNAYKAVDASA